MLFRILFLYHLGVRIWILKFKLFPWFGIYFLFWNLEFKKNGIYFRFGIYFLVFQIIVLIT